MNTKEIGAFLQALRKSKGYTQKDLAEILDVSDKTVSKWENGLGIPEMATLVVIADLYEVTVDEILRGTKRNIITKEQSNIQHEYLYKKVRTKYINMQYIVYGLQVLALLLLFMISSITSNSQLAMIIALIISLASIIVFLIINSNVLNQITSFNNEHNEKMRNLIYNKYVILTVITISIISFSAYFNVGKAFIPTSVYYMNKIAPSLTIAIIMTAFLSIIYKQKLKLQGKKIVLNFLLIASFLGGIISMNMIGPTNLAVKTSQMFISYSHYNKNENPERYYRIKYLYLLSEGKIDLSNEIYNDRNIIYIFDDGYELIYPIDDYIFNRDIYNLNIYRLQDDDIFAFFSKYNKKQITDMMYSQIFIIISFIDLIVYFVIKNSKKPNEKSIDE